MDFYKYAEGKLKECINNISTIMNNVELYNVQEKLEYGVIDSIHSLADYYERIDKSKLTAEDDLYFKAFAYINNQIKHDKKLQVICYPVSGSMFPLRFPMRFGKPGVVWNDFEDNGRNEARGKREHYDACLKGRDVETTMRKMFEILQRTNDLFKLED